MDSKLTLREIVVTGAGIALALLLGLGWTVWQWNECREAGLSVVYCLQHIG